MCSYNCVYNTALNSFDNLHSYPPEITTAKMMSIGGQREYMSDKLASLAWHYMQLYTV